MQVCCLKQLSIILEEFSSKRLSKYRCDFRAIALAVTMHLEITLGSYHCFNSILLLKYLVPQGHAWVLRDVALDELANICSQTE